jgi:hypothetical protein
VKIGTILGAINRCAAIHVCLAVFFAFCWVTHYAAVLKMQFFNRQFALMNDKTLRAMALIDWVAANWWLAVAYAFLAVASVAFLQFRGRPRWTWRVTALVFCIPCVVYWQPCAYIAGKLLGPVTFR